MNHQFAGEPAGEGTSLSHPAGNRQAAAVTAQHMFDDGEAQTDAAGGTGASGVHPIEALGESGEVVRRYAVTGVADRKMRSGVIGPPADS